MKKNNKVKGIYPVAVTPFNEDGSFNIEAAKKNLDSLIESGVTGICILGATGEYLSITNEEHKEYIKEIVPYIADRVSVIVGVTRERVVEVVELMENAKTYGADAAMVLPPYYSHPSQEEIFNHFKYVNDNVDLPMIVYNNPGSAGVEIETETFKKVLELSNAHVVKESTGDMITFTNLALDNEDTVMFCGCDNLAFESFSLGADGWISMSANIAPKKCMNLMSSIKEKKDFSEIKKIYADLSPILNMLESVSYPVQAIKYLMGKKGLDGGCVRLPRLELTAEQKSYIDETIDINNLY